MGRWIYTGVVVVVKRNRKVGMPLSLAVSRSLVVGMARR
jgi:hypothetical protein